MYEIENGCTYLFSPVSRDHKYVQVSSVHSHSKNGPREFIRVHVSHAVVAAENKQQTFGWILSDQIHGNASFEYILSITGMQCNLRKFLKNMPILLVYSFEKKECQKYPQTMFQTTFEPPQSTQEIVEICPFRQLCVHDCRDIMLFSRNVARRSRPDPAVLGY